MIEFTFDFYKLLLKTIQDHMDNSGFTFADHLSAADKPERFCIIRHDVDRDHPAALRMAVLESQLGIKTSYYFRAKDQDFKENAIKQISALGHEVGFHYESLSFARGDQDRALFNFKNCITNLKKIAPIQTISMHGSPLSRYNNLDLWKNVERSKIFAELGLLGDIILDIDYADITYITDTGRNWQADKANLRDKVKSNIKVDFHNGLDLLKFFKHKEAKKIVLHIHPERWADNSISWIYRFMKDEVTNLIKWILGIIRL
jgi:hypothetical protein